MSVGAQTIWSLLFRRMTLAEQSELIRMKLLMGLCPLAAAVRWADELILAGRATSEVIDVSVAQTSEPLRMAELLKLIEPEADRSLGAHLALAEFGNQLSTFTVDDAVHRLTQYMNWASVDGDETTWISGIDDELFCSQQGYYGSEQSVRELINRFVSRYAAVRAIG
jgi:hypothetical protein